MSDADGSTSALVPVEVQGWSLVKAGETDERLIDHREVAARLGYADPSKFKQLVERYRDSGDLGEVVTERGVSAMVAETGGRPAQVFYLTEFQALFCIGKSDTKIANDIYRQVIEVFLAVRRGQVQGQLIEVERQHKHALYLQEMEIDGQWRARYTREAFDAFQSLKDAQLEKMAAARMATKMMALSKVDLDAATRRDAVVARVLLAGWETARPDVVPEVKWNRFSLKRRQAIALWQLGIDYPQIAQVLRLSTDKVLKWIWACQ